MSIGALSLMILIWDGLSLSTAMWAKAKIRPPITSRITPKASKAAFPLAALAKPPMSARSRPSVSSAAAPFSIHASDAHPSAALPIIPTNPRDAKEIIHSTTISRATAPFQPMPLLP